MIMYDLGPQLGVWIMQVINKFHCSHVKWYIINAICNDTYNAYVYIRIAKPER